MPVQLTKRIDDGSIIRTLLYSRKELMDAWSKCIEENVVKPKKYCYIIKNVSLKQALVIAAMWMRKFKAPLSGTMFSLSNGGTLYLGFESILPKTGDIDCKAREILNETEVLTGKIFATSDFAEIVKDENGLSLFDNHKV